MVGIELLGQLKTASEMHVAPRMMMMCRVVLMTMMLMMCRVMGGEKELPEKSDLDAAIAALARLSTLSSRSLLSSSTSASTSSSTSSLSSP